MCRNHLTCVNWLVTVPSYPRRELSSAPAVMKLSVGSLVYFLTLLFCLIFVSSTGEDCAPLCRTNGNKAVYNHH